MSVLETIPNGASYKDVRDTMNDVLAWKKGIIAGGGTPTPTPTPAPTFTTPASITSDGTPQVGETLTGNDGVVANGSISARAWLLAGATVSTSAQFTPQQAGNYTYRATASGAGGTTNSSATVTVAAATPTPTPTPATFAMTQLPSSNRVYQRSTKTGGGPNKGTGTIPVNLNVTASGGIYARTRAADGTTVLQSAWLAVNNAPVANGPVDISGVEARNQYFFLDLAPSATGPWTNGTVLVAMGRLIYLSGQSLQVRNFRSSGDATTISGAGVTFGGKGAVLGGGPEIGTSGAWVQPSDAGPVTSAGAAELINLQANAFGVCVGLVMTAVGNSSVQAWQPGGDYLNAAVAAINAAGSKFEAAWWYQGHSDAGRIVKDVRAEFKSMMDALAGAMIGSPPSWYFTAIPNINSTNYGNNQSRNGIRGMYEDYAKLTAATYLPMEDIQLLSGEGVHCTQAGSLRQVQHFHRATGKELGGPGDQGCVYGVPTVSGTTVTLPYTLISGATNVTTVGDPKQRWRVSDLGTEASLPITSLTFGPTAATIVLGQAPASSAIEVGPFFQSGDDGRADMAFANLNEGDGTNMVGRELFVPGRAILSRPKFNLNTANITFGSGGAFGQGRTSGYFDVPIPSAFGTVSVEFFLTVNNVNGGIQVITTLPGDMGWLAIDGTQMGFNTDWQYTLAAGQTYHVVLVISATGKTWFMNGQFVQFGPLQDRGTAGRGVGIGSLGGNYVYTRGVIDEVAMFYNPQRYDKAGFAVPSAPYSGNEDGLLHLWHLDGNGTDSCTLNS
ncbi:hypothetical protein GCM10011380_09000 [Sphingomonas metalli]|uniref:Sialate O-acetylesterase domain-containing protein n=1 Tax=Sphingomonas metalli TaxID=1779358 RepID=A0A916T040_9SPHN|nr:sialate O-acetylesterase [Sphingomonas metalli]GGB21610.1 hypothetical protein GCM10011380_09000 [Sphingomonas metalli]